MGFEMDLAYADSGNTYVCQHQEYQGDICWFINNISTNDFMFKNGYSIVVGTAPPDYSNGSSKPFYGLGAYGFAENEKVDHATEDVSVHTVSQLYRFQWSDENKSEGKQYQVGDT
jgi:hypothetical protein